MAHYIKFSAAGAPLGHELNVTKAGVDNTSGANGKPYVLEAELVDPAFDPTTQAKSGPAYEARPARIVFTVADKGVAAMKAARVAQAKAEGDRRLALTYTNLDVAWGTARAIEQLAAGQAVGAAILAAIGVVTALRAKRESLIAWINDAARTAADLKALDVKAEEHWD